MALASATLGSGLDPTNTAGIGIQGAASEASPPRLILMLCDAGLAAMRSARTAHAQGRLAARRSALSRAIAILAQGLRPAVAPDAGEGLGASLVALYDYIADRLRYADLAGDAGSIDEATQLLAELRSAWQVLEQRCAAKPARTPGKRKSARAAGHART